MIRIPDRLLKPIAVFCAGFILQTAYADDLPVTAPDRFAIQLPVVDREALGEQLRALRSQLILRKQALVQAVADQQLDSGDAILTAILPGGLLYAGYKRARQAQANSELARVSAEIEELSGDLLALESSATTVMVAQLP